MKENILQYAWIHDQFALIQNVEGEFPCDGFRFHTTDGRWVEIIDRGRINTQSGPDVFKAVVRIENEPGTGPDGPSTLWVGNVEMHVHSSDWFLHRHHKNPAFNNVILHVVVKADRVVTNSLGQVIPQMEVRVSETLLRRIEGLIAKEAYCCRALIPSLPSIIKVGWLDALRMERLERKFVDVLNCLERCHGDWRMVYFRTLSHNLGFGLNGYAFDCWAEAMPLSVIDQNKGDLFRIVSLFFGQAGFLNGSRNKGEISSCDMVSEYRSLSSEFGVKSIDSSLWRYLRLRPQNFPELRLFQLAVLYWKGRVDLYKMLESRNMDDFYNLFDVDEDVQAMRMFEAVAGVIHRMPSCGFHISKATIDLILINTIVPVMFAYGKYTQKEHLCERALRLQEKIKPENNRIVREWQQCEFGIQSAADTQAIIHLHTQYCEPRRCLQCRFGLEYLKSNSYPVVRNE